MYCTHCGRVAHRCQCHLPDSRFRQFLARRHPTPTDVSPVRRPNPYKRGVPPQVKRRERAVLRRHYREWFDTLAQRDGKACLNCGATDALVLDHVVSVALGGRSEPENLQLLCRECNRIKGKLAIDCRVQ